MKKLLAAALALLLLAGCGSPEIAFSPTGETEATLPSVPQGTEITEPTPAQPDGEMFTDRDCRTEYDEATAVKITLSGNSVTASSDSVKISGTTAVLTEEATYVVSGKLESGMLVVNAGEQDKIQIVLAGAQIQSPTSAALYVLNADKVFLTLADGTENTLLNGGSFTAIEENNIDGALFSKQDLTINGGGSLTVTSPAGHGIVCKDDLVITGGSYQISAASHGLDANDSVRITGQTELEITAGKDGIHCENDDPEKGFVYLDGGSLDVTCEGDGVAAGAWMQVTGGNIQVLAGGGNQNGTKANSGNYGGFMGGRRPGDWSSPTTQEEDSVSMKGLKSAGEMTISGGVFQIDSADDSLHSDTSLTISGGEFTIASGDDGIHAEEKLTVSQGNVTVSACYEGLEALEIYISGGKFLIHASDDGLNAAGGTDQSGTTGGRDGMFGGRGQGGGGGFGSQNGVIDISGGSFTIYSSGDGLDANGSLTISGGYLHVMNPTSGDTSVLDADQSPVITGGTFIGAAATSAMAQSFSSASSQGVIACTVGNQAAGNQITIRDADGNAVIDFALEYPCRLLIFSSPRVEKGASYHVTAGTASGTVEAG